MFVMTAMMFPDAWWLVLTPGVLSLLATYSAATGRDMSSYYRLTRYSKQEYQGETSAALTFSVISFGISALLIIVFLSGIEFLLVGTLCAIGALLVLLGGIVAWREWEG